MESSKTVGFYDKLGKVVAPIAAVAGASSILGLASFFGYNFVGENIATAGLITYLGGAATSVVGGAIANFAARMEDATASFSNSREQFYQTLCYKYEEPRSMQIQDQAVLSTLTDKDLSALPKWMQCEAVKAQRNIAFMAQDNKGRSMDMSEFTQDIDYSSEDHEALFEKLKNERDGLTDGFFMGGVSRRALKNHQDEAVSYFMDKNSAYNKSLWDSEDLKTIERNNIPTPPIDLYDKSYNGDTLNSSLSTLAVRDAGLYAASGHGGGFAAGRAIGMALLGGIYLQYHAIVNPLAALGNNYGLDLSSSNEPNYAKFKLDANTNTVMSANAAFDNAARHSDPEQPADKSFSQQVNRSNPPINTLTS